MHYITIVNRDILVGTRQTYFKAFIAGYDFILIRRGFTVHKAFEILLINIPGRGVTRALIGGRSVYSYIRVLPQRISFEISCF